MTKLPRSPAGFGAAGRALWRKIHAELPEGWALDEREAAILALACRQADDLAHLEQAVREDGAMVTGSTGQPVVHPAIREARAARQAIGRLLARLDLGNREAAAEDLEDLDRAYEPEPAAPTQLNLVERQGEM
jgi:P27 family predicted phage terminase small subunit